jgi:tetrahydromethanopterin S-methyltransferase subunit F
VSRFSELFPGPLPVIGLIHLPPLPGYPESPGIDRVVRSALDDLHVLESGKVDGVLVDVPLTAAAVGIVSRRSRLAGGAMVTLVTGLAVGSLAALVLTRLLRLIGSIGPDVDITDSTLEWLTTVDVATVGVALVAGVAAMVASETRASQAVGVAISVTTIPAAAFVGVATALGRMTQAGEALTVLAINVAALLVAATTTVAVQRRFLG